MERSNKIREQTKRRMRRKRRISDNLSKFKGNIENKQSGISDIIIEEESHSKSVEQLSLEEKLRVWSHKHNITRMAMNDLLNILIFFGFTMLPKDSRTLMLTPRNIEIKDVANGRLWYNGVESNIRRIFRTLEENLTLFLNFNVDRIPLFNSSKTEFWPILTNLHGK